MDSHIENAEVVATLRRLAAAPVLPHIILYGPSGIGKTHLARLFIREYLGSRGVPPEKYARHILAVPSSEDRGIKFVRTQVRDFAKETHRIATGEGASSTGTPVSQIILMDDCDTLPVLSQQALRRIMEQHESQTAFIFIANRINVFIDPIQSRCVVLHMTPVNVQPYATRLADEYGCCISTEALNHLVKLSVGNLRQFTNYLHVLSLVLGDREATEKDVEQLCDGPPVAMIQQLLAAYLSGNTNAAVKCCVSLWEAGYPLQDVINYVQIVCNVYVSYDNDEMLRINECVGEGSVMCIDNRVSLWDSIALFAGKPRSTIRTGL